MTNQSSLTDDERDPWISNDGLRLYYAFQPAGKTSDIYLATRADPNATTAFGAGVRQDNLSTSDNDEGRPALTPDEKTFVMATDRADNGDFKIALSTRGDTGQPFGTPDGTHLSNVNNTSLGTSHFDPFLSADGLHLYYAPAGPSPQRLAMAVRTDVNSDFANGAALDPVNSGKSTDADPAVSLDEKILVFSSTRAGGGGGATDLWYATRADKTQLFGAPRPVPDVNSADEDGDPMLSADGCTLYFASTRGAGTSYDLYAAAVSR